MPATFQKHECSISMPIRDAHVTLTGNAVCVLSFRRKWQKRYIATPKRLEMRRTREPEPLFGHSSRADQALLKHPPRQHFRGTDVYHRWLPNQKRSSGNRMIQKYIFETVNARPRFLFPPARRDILLQDFLFQYPLSSKFPAPGSNVRPNDTKVSRGPAPTAD